MSIEAIVGVAVGGTVLLAFTGRLLWSVHRGVNLIQHLRDDVADVQTTLNNGLRADIRVTKEQAGKASVLAADAARAAAVADQHAAEGREEITRAVNALRAEVDVYTNVVLSDRRGVRRALRGLGVELDEDE